MESFNGSTKKWVREPSPDPVLDDEGKVIHMQDSSFLEEGQGYNQSKVLRFFKNWTPKAVKG